MQKHLNKWFNKLFVADKWNIGYLHQSVSALIEKQALDKPINWMMEDFVDYAADPFVIEVDDKPRIYYEELNFWKGKGEIMMIDDFNFSGKTRVKGITPSSIHLSYPFLITYENEQYCIPETSASKEISLYKIDKQKPNHLIKTKVLLQGEAYVDTSVICYEEKFWLFTSISKNDNELHIYYSDKLDGDYKPHQQSPLRVGKNACRAAGNLFTVDGKLYRPTQNPTNHYGGSIVFNEITLLNEYEYKANYAFEIFPDDKYSRGIHNISFVNDLIVVDGKRRVTNPIMPFKKLVRKLNTLY